MSDPDWWPEEEPPSKPSAASFSEKSSSGPNLGASRRPLTAMMDRSGGLAGGKKAEALSYPPVQADLQSYPAVPTTSTRPAGGVEEAESPSRYMHETDSMWCPFEMAGETWEACCAEVDQEFIELVAKIRAANSKP